MRNPTPNELALTGSIHHSMRPLFKRAMKDVLRFHSKIDPDVVFVPSDLALQQAQGRYMWGPHNWTLKK